MVRSDAGSLAPSGHRSTASSKAVVYTVPVWEVEYTDQFGDWWDGLTVKQQAAVADRVELLAERGPSLKRPSVGTVKSSRHKNMKELRASSSRVGALRVLFAFDSRRHAILLLGGDKSGNWDAWYEWAVPAADDLYDFYLRELADEGLM